MGANVLYWRRYLRHCWDFSAPPSTGNVTPWPPVGMQFFHEEESTTPLSASSTLHNATAQMCKRLNKQSPYTMRQNICKRKYIHVWKHTNTQFRNYSCCLASQGLCQILFIQKTICMRNSPITFQRLSILLPRNSWWRMTSVNGDLNSTCLSSFKLERILLKCFYHFFIDWRRHCINQDFNKLLNKQNRLLFSTTSKNNFNNLSLK